MKIAILATDGFEQAELIDPCQASLDAGVTAHVISSKAGTEEPLSAGGRLLSTRGRGLLDFSINKGHFWIGKPS